jgi:ABC-type transport system substrate-binding protein
VSEGLVVIDDHTLQVNLGRSYPTWATHVTAFNAGFSKLDQVLSTDEEWWAHPIAIGPYSLVGDPDSGDKVLTRVELVGGQWWGEDSTIDKVVLPVIRDGQVRVIMMENGELDISILDPPTWAAASSDPNHPFNKMLRPVGNAGLWYMQPNLSMAPMEDLLVRQALANGVDMQTIITAVMGPGTLKATGILSPTLPCGDITATGHIYDPDLARLRLAGSTYASADNLPVLRVDVHHPPIVNAMVPVKEYWKDNLGVELDILKRESGMPRRTDAQIRRFSGGATFPDELQLLDQFTRRDIGVLAGGDPSEFVILDSLMAYASSLPPDHPDRCLAYDAVSLEYMSRVFMIPFDWHLIKRWAVQPWVKGFENHLYGNPPYNKMFIEKH